MVIRFKYELFVYTRNLSTKNTEHFPYITGLLHSVKRITPMWDELVIRLVIKLALICSCWDTGSFHQGSWLFCYPPRLQDTHQSIFCYNESSYVTTDVFLLRYGVIFLDIMPFYVCFFIWLQNLYTNRSRHTHAYAHTLD